MVIARSVVAVTGANGYVGGLLARAIAGEAEVISLVRRPNGAHERVWCFEMSESEMAMTLRLASVTKIIHAAWEMRANSLDELSRVCVEGTRRLVVAAKMAGVETLIFISTISSFEAARSAYGKSKLKAEGLVLAQGGLVLRLGLVYGSSGGGVFGGLVKAARRLPMIPAIRGGTGNQYLLHEGSLSVAIQRAIRGEFTTSQRTLTLAHPQPISLMALLKALAEAQERKIRVVSVPWRVLYCLLRFGELARLPLSFRSDSLLSFVHQNPTPDFAALREHHIDMVPFTLKAWMPDNGSYRRRNGTDPA